MRVSRTKEDSWNTDDARAGKENGRLRITETHEGLAAKARGFFRFSAQQPSIPAMASPFRQNPERLTRRQGEPRRSAKQGSLRNRLDNGEVLPFTHGCTRVPIANVTATDETRLWPSLRIDCEGDPLVYQAGGLRTPKVPHPHYDPCPSDIAH